MLTNLTIIKIYRQFTKSVTSFLIKEPKYQDSTEKEFCAVNTRPMYQDIKTKNCQLPKIQSSDLEITKIKPPQETLKVPEQKISEEMPTALTEIQIIDKDDQTPTNKSIEMPKSLERHLCNRIILVESPILRRKSLWITPKPSSVYKEHYKSIPKIMNIKY